MTKHQSSIFVYGALAIAFGWGIYECTTAFRMTDANSAQAILCISNQKRLAFALKLYATDYDESLPPPTRWLTSLTTYTDRSTDAFRCPAIKQEHGIGVALNSSVRNLFEGRSAATTILIHDSSNLALNAADALTSIPVPARHHGTNIFVFVDGHAKRILAHP